MFFPCSLIWSTMFLSHPKLITHPVCAHKPSLGRKARPCSPETNGWCVAWWLVYQNVSGIWRWLMWHFSIPQGRHGNVGWQTLFLLPAVPLGMWKVCAAALCSLKEGLCSGEGRSKLVVRGELLSSCLSGTPEGERGRNAGCQDAWWMWEELDWGTQKRHKVRC